MWRTSISPLSLNSLHFLRQIPSNHSRNDDRLGEPFRRRGRGASGLGQVVTVGAGDPLDHPDVEQPAQLPR